MGTRYMLKRTVNRGCICLDMTWQEAIDYCFSHPSDCGIEPVYEVVIKQTILDDAEKVFVGYQIYGYGNGRKYVTRIPKSLNNYVRELLDSAS
jgi:hypothetical protein